MKALKVTISGSYRTAESKIMDYSGITGVIPFQDEEIATMHIRRRYARMWIMKDPSFKERLYSVRECYIDDMQETEHNFSYVGKDVKELTYEELQDLATAKDLRLIPQYKKTSEREARILAYAAYSEQVLKEKIDYRAAGFNLTKQPPIIIDGAWRKDTTKKLTNDEVLAGESVIGAKKTSLSRTELEQIAKSKNVTFSPLISDEKLYERIYA